MGILFHKYASEKETIVYEKLAGNSGKTKCNHILRGTWVGVLEESGDWYRIITAGPDGWVRKTSVSDEMGLKIFFIDVGQGDAMLLEVGRKKILIDGGPNDSLKNYLEGWQYKYVLENNQKVHFDYLFISHFDKDHYNGIIDLLNNPSITFGAIYHNGIARFYTDDQVSDGKIRPDNYNKDLGEVKDDHLMTYFNDFEDLKALKNKGGFQYTFDRFYSALKNAIDQNRVEKVERLTNESTIRGSTIEGKRFKINVLGPVLSDYDGKKVYEWFEDSSHTRNGHSLVLKIEFGSCSILAGGDLNHLSEEFLMKHYHPSNPFEVDVAKSCHHGAAEFLVSFMEKISPYATVISSGDNENYAHPQADAIGCAGKYSKGIRPLVFSTELARSINSGGEILYGMINLRCNGNDIIMAQMKEKGVAKGTSIWDRYNIK